MRVTLLALFVLAAGCASVPGVGEAPPTGDLARGLPTFEAPETSDPTHPAKLEPTGDLTLRQALALALLHNPQLEAHAWQMRASEAAILQSHLSPNPVLGLRVENFGGDDALREFDGAVSTLRISQAIELGDKRLRRTQLARRLHTLATWDYEAERLTVIAQTGHRYIDVLAAQHEVDLAAQALTVAEGLHAIIKQRADEGVTPTAELNKALVQVTARRIDLETQRRQLAALRQQLSALWDSSTASFRRVDGALFDVPPLPAPSAMVERIEHNPDLARWPVEIAARQAAVELADTGRIPNLTLGAGVRQFNATDDHALVFEMALPLPLTNRNQGARRQARYDLHKARALERHMRASAHATLNEMIQTLRAQHYAATTLRDQGVPAAQAAFDAARKAFAQGVTDYIDVLDAERTLIATQYDQVSALAALHKTLISIEAFLGTDLSPEPEAMGDDIGPASNTQRPE